MSPVRLSTIVVYSSLWNYFMCAVRFLFYLILGGALYGVDLSQANLLSALTIFALTILCFMGIGILWAGMVVLIKRGESIITVVGTLVLMVSGVFYPTHLLPDWMRTLSEVIPLTHALDGMRHALLQGFSLSELSDVTLTLGLFAILLMAMGLSSFNLSVRIGKQTGSLTQY